MSDLSKLRQGLRCCISEGTCAEMTAILRDALDAITPRLLTLDEAIDRMDDAVYLEERGGGVTAVIVADANRQLDAVWMKYSGGQLARDMSEYGRDWRCWTLPPDYKARKDEGWHEHVVGSERD